MGCENKRGTEKGGEKGRWGFGTELKREPEKQTEIEVLERIHKTTPLDWSPVVGYPDIVNVVFCVSSCTPILSGWEESFRDNVVGSTNR